MECSDSESLAVLVSRGGIYQDIPGYTVREVLLAFSDRLSLPASVKRDSLLTAVLEREALMSTSIGRGIALPHPRTPLVTERGEQLVALGFTRRPVDWNALDGRAVDTVILILSASAKMHLHTLSKINFLCRLNSFAALLESRAAGEEIIRMIEATEKTWI